MANGILTKIAARLGRTPATASALEAAFAQLKSAAEPTVAPAMAADTQAFFIAQAEKNLFEISQIADIGDAVASLHTALPLVLSPQPAITALPWRERGFALVEDARQPALGVVAARAGIAETGTVVIGSKDVPSALLFLAEELVVILRKETIVATQDELWQQLPPLHQRALHLISGPSRTADVEQTLQVGAHGPRRVYLWLV